MKKVLIAMAVLTSMVAGAMVFSSFVAPKQDVKKEYAQTEANAPTYWEGSAKAQDGWDYLIIKVYQTEGQCNSFYAIITGAYATNYESGKELWVKMNPDFVSTSERSKSIVRGSRYYVSYHNKDFYFNM